MEKPNNSLYSDIDPVLAEQKASYFNVSPLMHPKDYLMHFLYFKSTTNNDQPAAELNYYFGDAVNCVNNLLR